MFGALMIVPDTYTLHSVGRQNTSLAAVEVPSIASKVLRHIAYCTLDRFLAAVLCCIFGHHGTPPYIKLCLIMLVYIQFAIWGINPRVHPKARLITISEVCERLTINMSGNIFTKKLLTLIFFISFLVQNHFNYVKLYSWYKILLTYKHFVF